MAEERRQISLEKLLPYLAPVEGDVFGAPRESAAHASDERDLRRRCEYRRMLEEGLFAACVVIRAGKEGRRYCWKRLEP